MAKLPFKVSARAARLIGRENVATSQGAMTELVKNAYDADASACLILFLPNGKDAPKSITEKQLAALSRSVPDANKFFPLIDGKRNLRQDLSEQELSQINSIFRKILNLWIVDNGHGMSSDTIESHWMVIGTDSKEFEDTSIGGRTFTGAKGIGRFALDRLGMECELFSGEADHTSIVQWLVDWGDFEGAGKILDDVQAVLDMVPQTLSEAYESNGISNFLPKNGPSPDGKPDELGHPLFFDKGTAIKISYLHDYWDERDSMKLRQTLEALLPPKERGDFNIYVYDYRAVENSGWIDNFPPDQFDYRLFAKVETNGEVLITLDRQEIDALKIRSSVFEMKEMQTPSYKLDDFKRGSITYKKNLNSILKIQKNDLDDYLAIGPFDFTMYFFKLSNPTSDNLKRYPQKSFDVSKRRQWLSSSGGIRLYRDGFRVRPYGEPNTQGSDWLLLGQRVAANPAAASRIGWRVLPQQLAGTINITKKDNPLLADQSNREGIMNERVFAAFRKVILALITEFENDRSYIFHHFDKAYESDNKDEAEVEEGKQLAEELLVVKDIPSNSQTDLPFSGTDDLQSQSLKIAKAYKSEEQKNEALKDDIQVMRGMATLGTVLVSFTHELKQIKANMESRNQRMENALSRVIDTKKLESLPKQLNPFEIIKRWNREDEKISRWVDFALSAVSPTKRRRRIIDLREYFNSLSTHWDEFLKTKQIGLHIDFDSDEKIAILAHEIDLDSIFYNLIINSIEAFIKPSQATSRDIWLTISQVEKKQLQIDYKDNGPGLTSNFNVADDIFMFGVSSKPIDGSSDLSGTGIGMWLVKNIVDDYKGVITLLSNIGEANFSLLIKLPRYVE
ncbi:MAG: GHKL domain-containing protein [Methylotenera sp.]|nr:GHKL domain-containing protein [Methylotenera sp.]